MASDDPSIPIEDVKPGGAIPAAYTYFGQFIDHDLMFDRSDLPAAGSIINPEDIINSRRSFLNLDTVYGDGPTQSNIGTLYEDEVFFRLGAALSNGRSFDVPLGVECAPVTGDPRNTENAIVRQIHAMFLQLHNLAAEDLIGKKLPTTQVFADARARVRHQFQWLVRNDFLPAVCDTGTIEQIRKRPGRLIEWKGHPFSIPVEFAQAAFRFGHSMVRDGYRLGRGDKFKLSEIFGGAASRGALPTKLAVNWDEFCAVAGNPQFARPMGTTVVKDLYQVPTSSIQVFMAALVRSGEERVLPLRTLHRGAASCLSSGEGAVAYLLGHKPTRPVIRKPSTNYPPNKTPFDRLDGAGLRDATPLWYYILMEAELNEAGNRLGMLGSYIVAGTIEGALWSNPDSYVQEGPAWRPDPWKARDGSSC